MKYYPLIIVTLLCNSILFYTGYKLGHSNGWLAGFKAAACAATKIEAFCK